MDADLYGNPAAIFKRIQFCHDLEFECAMPAKITKINNDHTAYAQPLVRLMSSSSSIEQSPILVTTLWDFHGDFEIHHPLNVGDTGWLIAADRNTDLVKQYNSEWDEKKNQGSQSPNKDLNLHRYRFGFFIPDRWNTGADKRLVPKELQECFYIRDRNGHVQMLLDEEGTIAITAKLAVEIYGDFLVHGDSVFDGDALFKQNVTVDGKLLAKELEVSEKAYVKSLRSDNAEIENATINDLTVKRINGMTEKEITCVSGIGTDSSGNTILTMKKMTVFMKNDDVVGTAMVKASGGGGGGDGLKSITFHSASDSNVTFDVTNNDGNVDVTVGVYYL